MAESDFHVMPDGLLCFGVKNAAGEVRQHSIDVLILRIACDECVAEHRLQTDDQQRYVMTAAFLTTLAGRIAALGIEGCSPSVAYQLWRAAVEGIEHLQKKTNETPSLDSGSTSTPEG